MFARLASKGALSKSLTPQSSPLSSPKNTRRKINLEQASPKSQHRSYGDSSQSSVKINDQTGSLLVGAAATIASAAALAGSYYYTHEETVPITGRKRMLDVSKERERGLADKTFANLMKRFHDKILPADHRHSTAVKRVGSRIIKSSGIASLQDLEWEFIVIESPDINAFVLPNGKVCVFTGILDLMEDENGMATVLSHEIAHVAARHSAEHLSLGRFFWNGESVCRFLGFHNMGDWLSNQLERMPFQRFCETEADHIGLILMSKAQYDPTKSVEIWKRLQVFQQLKKVESHPTHPSHQERIDNIMKWLPEAIHAQRGCSCH